MKKSRRYFSKALILYVLYIAIVFLVSILFLNSDARINRFLKQNDIPYSEHFYTFPKDSPIDEYRIYNIKINENSLSKYKKIKTPYLLKSLYYRLDENDVYESELKNLLNKELYFLIELIDNKDPITKKTSHKHYVVFYDSNEQFYIRVKKP